MTHPYIQKCIEQCWAARHACQQTLYTHCLRIGGMHMEEQHVKLMTDCIEICQLTADFMTRNSAHHEALALLCADICEACAKACDRIGDEAMLRCKKACEACAESCRSVETIPHAA